MNALRLARAALAVLSFGFVTSSLLASVSIKVSWDRNTESNLAGYHVKYGPVSNPSQHVVEVHSNTVTLSDLIVGRTYLIAVAAYNTNGKESAYSNSIGYLATTSSSGGQEITLDNISSRLSVQNGENVLIGGFIVQGSTPKLVAVRALGPSLADAGVAGAMADPLLEVRDSAGGLIASNDSWNQGDGSELLALGLAPSDSREAALVLALPAGTYSAVVRGNGSSRGVGLFELYNLDRIQGSVANISTRGRVDTGDQVMIGGFIVGGSTPTRVIMRALGPSLVQQGVADALLDPTLELYDSEGSLLISNDDWRSDQGPAINATGVPPSDNREAAIVRTLAPGVYSVIVRGKNDTTGVALFEVYAIDQ